MMESTLKTATDDLLLIPSDSFIVLKNELGNSSVKNKNIHSFVVSEIIPPLPDEEYSKTNEDFGCYEDLSDVNRMLIKRKEIPIKEDQLFCKAKEDIGIGEYFDKEENFMKVEEFYASEELDKTIGDLENEDRFLDKEEKTCAQEVLQLVAVPSSSKSVI